MHLLFGGPTNNLSRHDSRNSLINLNKLIGNSGSGGPNPLIHNQGSQLSLQSLTQRQPSFFKQLTQTEQPNLQRMRNMSLLSLEKQGGANANDQSDIAATPQQ